MIIFGDYFKGTVLQMSSPFGEVFHLFALLAMKVNDGVSYIYSQTRSSVPVANELMNSFTEKWFRLLIE